MRAQVNTLWNALDNVQSGDDSVAICCPPFDNALKHGLNFIVSDGFLTVSYEGDHGIFKLTDDQGSQKGRGSLRKISFEAIETASSMLEEVGLTLEDVF